MYIYVLLGRWDCKNKRFIKEVREGAKASREAQSRFSSCFWSCFLFIFPFCFLIRNATSMRFLQDELYLSKLKKSNERLLALVKASMDLVVAIGLLQLAPKKVTPRVTGGFGFISSLISCYQVISLDYTFHPAVCFWEEMSHVWTWPSLPFYVQLLPAAAPKAKTPWRSDVTYSERLI